MIAAIDIGGTKIALGLVSEDGRILARATTPTIPGAGFPAAIARMRAILEQLRGQVGGQPVGIGIGCTGPVDPVSGILGNVDTLPGWQGCGLTEALRSATGLNCRVENDADAHALAEYTYGFGRGADPFVMVTIGTGIGGGLIREGKIYRGLAGAHPEPGHQMIEASGPMCVCGAQGCWEALASGPAWEAWFHRNHPECADWDGRRICAAAERGDARGIAAVRREGFYLGVGLANLINVLAPQAIALGGGLMERFQLFEPFIREEIRKSCAYLPHELVRLGRTSLGTDSGLIGAAQVWVQGASEVT
jgi:glucokinase